MQSCCCTVHAAAASIADVVIVEVGAVRIFTVDSCQIHAFPSSLSRKRKHDHIQILLPREEVLKHPLDAERGWSTRLLPLAEELVSKYRSFLPNLAYPVRAGTHTNTAFGLVFPVEYDQHGG